MSRLAAVYVRISRDDVGDQTSTARQERLCRRYAAEQSWEVVELFRRSLREPEILTFDELIDRAEAAVTLADREESSAS